MAHSHCNFDCPICGVADKEIQFYGFSHCNHPICAVCAIKLQKFSKDTGNDYDYSKCVICKQDISKIIVAPEIRLFEDYNVETMLADNPYGLLFESISARKFYDSVIRISCPECRRAFGTVDEVMMHTTEHKKRYCELCISFNKCLISELDIFTDNDYHQHRNKKHPKCRFCEIRFYDDSELIKHVKKEHFVCDICHRNQGFVAYSTQAQLLKHYMKDHYVCEICHSNNNINVFESEYVLKTHKVSSHAHSLVTEGLVNVNYGSRDNLRHGARRRARDVYDGDLGDAGDVAVAPQPMPAVNSEHEFPRLGADSVATQLQLGTPSTTTDENDSRTAFVQSARNGAAAAAADKDDSGWKHQLQQPSNGGTARPHKTERMADNFAISVKKSAGSLNSEDFPSLSTNSAPAAVTRGNVRVPEFSRIRPVNIVANNGSAPKPPQSAIHKLPSSDDFPSLPSSAAGKRAGPVHKAPPSRSWGPIIDESANTAPVAATERSAKVTMMSRDDFVQANNPAPVTQHRQQQVPTAQDFPQLGSGSGNVATTNAAGTWGAFTIPSDVRNGNLQKLAQKSKTKQKQQKSQSQPIKQAKEQNQPIRQEKEQNYPIKSQNQPASLRGIDYIPGTTALVKETIAFVDPHQFSSIKSSGATVSVAAPAPVASHTSESYSGVDNRFSGLCLDGGDDIGQSTNNYQQPPQKLRHASSKPPIISSESDFPALGGGSAPRQKQQHQQQQQKPLVTSKAEPRRKKDEKQSNTAKVVTGAATASPVVSLMDVAMGVVTKRNYTPFPDTAERNESMLQLLYERLDVGLATQFLQLSGLYRNRQLSVQDYLDALSDAAAAFRNVNDTGSTGSDKANLECIGRMLPQMCVLLPDIPLQRSLMSGMPKEWVRDLRECARCEQVLHEADVAEHNALAH